MIALNEWELWGGIKESKVRNARCCHPLWKRHHPLPPHCSSMSRVCRRRCCADIHSHFLVFRSFTFPLKAGGKGSGDALGLREWQCLHCADVIVCCPVDLRVASIILHELDLLVFFPYFFFSKFGKAPQNPVDSLLLTVDLQWGGTAKRLRLNSHLPLLPSPLFLLLVLPEGYDG